MSSILRRHKHPSDNGVRAVDSRYARAGDTVATWLDAGEVTQGAWAGGVYLWETRAAAEAFYSGPWRDGIRERYGMDPQITFFETACATDNASGAVLLAIVPDAAQSPAT